MTDDLVQRAEMTDDLILRLRDWDNSHAADPRGFCMVCSTRMPCEWAVVLDEVKEAADEVERLRKTVATYRWLNHEDQPMMIPTHVIKYAYNEGERRQSPLAWCGQEIDPGAEWHYIDAQHLLLSLDDGDVIQTNAGIQQPCPDCVDPIMKLLFTTRQVT